MKDGHEVQVVALNGSPHRKGNTVALMGWVLDGCVDAGATVEWMHVVDHEIRYCQGCFTCLRQSICPIEDDFLSLRERLLAADGIVVGSPAYMGEPTAQLKTLLDRLTLLNLYTHTFERQFAVGVATSGIAPCGDLARALGSFFGWRSGSISTLVTSVAHSYRPLSEFHDPRLPQRARRLGERLVRDIRTPERPHLLYSEMIVYRLTRRLFVDRLVRRHPEQFAGVLRIWKEKAHRAELTSVSLSES